MGPVSPATAGDVIGGDVVVAEHWGSSGFANTDLDFQLKQHGITHVVVAGLLAETCVEATARFAMELGCHVMLVRDATAALSPERMQAAHELNGPTCAHGEAGPESRRYRRDPGGAPSRGLPREGEHFKSSPCSPAARSAPPSVAPSSKHMAGQ
ncbi:isochorismatase family protein [Streptomyces sp. NPDC002573]|uniref:isochorismatase family protein n=1 Tax=Streptomyces sp. NPDC002573 TaxID=3364651 RepID=UPI003679A8F6